MASDPSSATRPRAEQIFFEDPAIDRLFGVIMALATETYVLKDRLAALERALSEQNLLDVAALAAEPSPEETAALTADRDAFVAHLLDSLLGLEVSQSTAGSPGT
ncbi:MAG: hypothetical protein OXD42_07750 [Rhodospirillaceae bacterium]|nr:hypothetical protein [Rhodospirillaceae bacterium]